LVADVESLPDGSLPQFLTLGLRPSIGYSGKMAAQTPDHLDFAFVNGDDWWEGIKTDWRLVSWKMRSG
jgi:hypothetical protein